MTKVFIDPACDILYSSFYIYGLGLKFGKRNIHFTSKYFDHFNHNNHFFAFVVKEDDSQLNCVVDFTDVSRIKNYALDWCDVYGKINATKDILEISDKIIPIGPSFGIQIYGFFGSILIGISNLLKAYRRIDSKKRFLADYKSQYQRLSFRKYRKQELSTNYVYFVSSLWKKQPETNNSRANFIRACKNNPKLVFEGGFAPRTKNDIDGFEDITLASRVSMTEYIKKIGESILAFNTPAVRDCHGWKLAEFLCLGKAILSTPLSRELPAPLLDNTHFILVNGTYEQLYEQIDILAQDAPLRKYLEKNAERYFLDYLAPEVVINNLIEKASNRM